MCSLVRDILDGEHASLVLFAFYPLKRCAENLNILSYQSDADREQLIVLLISLK